jgi:hypothetical protein
MQQMGDMIGQANEQLAELTDSSGERRDPANGLPGQGVIVAHGPPERGAQGAPARGEVRPAAGSGFVPAPAPSSAGGGDHLAQLERLAKLRGSGTLTDAEFEQQKAKILGS